MAQGDKRNSKGNAGGNSRPGSGRNKKPSGSRQSVAAAREMSARQNRTQLIIGGIAIVVIVAIIVIGLVMNKKQNAVQGEGYGGSTQSVATATNGIVTVSRAGSAPTTSIDLYEDALCPICAEFEQQFGQQVNQAIDDGKLAVNVHMLTFLNPQSFSKDYSTRAAAALLCVAQQDGSTPGVYLAFHSALFATGTQPAEGGSSDLTNQQLADLATKSGAPNAAGCITSGQNIDAAIAADTASRASLSKATGGQVGTPTVVHNGAPLQLSVDWLTKLLAQG